MTDCPLAYAFAATPGPQAAQALLLAESIRRHGGALAQGLIWILLPFDTSTAAGTDPVSRLDPALVREMVALGARLHPVPLPTGGLDFPYAYKPLVAAAAESHAEGRARVLAWMDTDAILFHEPTPWLLAPGELLGCCPVDLANVSARLGQPVDGYWRAVYTSRSLDPDDLSPVTTTVDRVAIRPHFNVGLLATRPEAGLFRTWRTTFLEVYRRPAVAEFYDRDPRYRVFVHQAAFAAVAAGLEAGQRRVLPLGANYSMLLHARYPDEGRLPYVDDAIFARYDFLLEDPGWRGTIPRHEAYQAWMDRRLAELKLSGS